MKVKSTRNLNKWIYYTYVQRKIWGGKKIPVHKSILSCFCKAIKVHGTSNKSNFETFYRRFNSFAFTAYMVITSSHFSERNSALSLWLWWDIIEYIQNITSATTKVLWVEHEYHMVGTYLYAILQLTQNHIASTSRYKIITQFKHISNGFICVKL